MKLQAVILDWAGTTVDFGSQAPVAVMQEIFSMRDVPVSAEEARSGMGLLKKDHIRTISTLKSVQERWHGKHGRLPQESDVEQMFEDFKPRQLDALRQHSRLIPGTLEAVSQMRARGLKIGSTTGYTRPMLDDLVALAAEQGYRPDCAVSPDDVGGGRPMPWMIYRNAIDLGLFPLTACVKIGDTPSDIEEGRNAGMWTVAVAATGNEVGWTLDEFEATAEPERSKRIEAAKQRLQRARPDYVVDTVLDSMALLDEIEARCS
ncbi:MAG: phosphonoacetaldehyde hydrolase [Acidobacteriaceae bacterium]